MLRHKLRSLRILALMILYLVLSHNAVALDASVSTTVNVTAASVFSMEFYTDNNVVYSTVVPFSNVDPKLSIVYPNGRSEDDGKSDTGVTCISNIGDTWYLKIQGSYSAGLPVNSVKYYYSQPINRNTGQQANGSLTNIVEWRPIPAEPSTMYTSGTDDTISAPFGTLSTFSFSLDPRGLSAGQTYTISVTYTMTTAP